MHKTRRTADQMFPLVKRYLQGKQRAAAFCAEHGLTLSQLQYWRRKYRSTEVSPHSGAFQEITAPPANARAFVEVTYPDGVHLRLFTPVSSTYLTTLLAREGVS